MIASNFHHDWNLCKWQERESAGYKKAFEAAVPLGAKVQLGFLVVFWLIPSQPKMQVMLATFMTGPE